MSTFTQSAIVWPAKFLPGTTDNFATNEVITRGVTASQIWAPLSDISKWESYYHNVAEITPPSSGPHLKQGDTFKFSTFGFPVLTPTVYESVAPENGRAGRLSWSAKLDGDDDTRVEFHHAWLVEDLDGGRVRILTQESQIGKPAIEFGASKPNKMILGHQDWAEGLVRYAKGEPGPAVKDTDLGSVYGNL